MKGVTVDFYLLQREAVSIESINGQNWGTLVRGWALCHPTPASSDYLSSCHSSELINALNCQASRLRAPGPGLASLSSPSPALSELYRGCPLTQVAVHDEAVSWINTRERGLFSCVQLKTDIWHRSAQVGDILDIKTSSRYVTLAEQGWAHCPLLTNIRYLLRSNNLQLYISKYAKCV